MDDSHLPFLPVELLVDVACNMTKVADLCSFALVNVPCNYASTAILYADITLDNPYTTRKCLHTLTRPSTLCSFRRDLPSFIRSFAVDRGAWYADEDEGSDESDMTMPDKLDPAEFYSPTPRGVPTNGLRPTLENAVLRMYNLHHFSCWESSMFTPKTFARLVEGPAAPSLRVLGATMEDWRLPPYRLSLHDAFPTYCRLQKVHFILPSNQLDWDGCVGYVGRLLKTSATHLESLALDLSSSHTDLHAQELFSDIRVLTALEVLRIPTATDLSSIPHAPRLRCLQLDCNYSGIGRDEVGGRRCLPPSLYPRLERIYCSHVDLPAFLPADTDTRRPIHAVFLHEAVYSLGGGKAHSREPLSLLPNSSSVLGDTLRRLPNYAVPVTELNLFLDCVDVMEIRKILPYIKHLEQLVIVTGHRPRRLKSAHLLGKTVFAHMPRLHTFLLCATARERTQPTCMYDGRGGYLYEQQKTWLHAFDRHASWLRRVMFTAGLEWVKGANGTWDVVEAMFGFVAPIAAALRSSEAVVDLQQSADIDRCRPFAFDLINLIPTQADAAETEINKLLGTFGLALTTYGS